MSVSSSKLDHFLGLGGQIQTLMHAYQGGWKSSLGTCSTCWPSGEGWAVALQGDWCPHGEGAQVEGFPPEPHWSWDLEALTRDEMRGDAPGPGAASRRPRRQSGLNPTTQGPFRNPPRGHCPPSQKPSG